MSTSKFASLEGVDFDTPDVYETNSPSPTRKTRGLPGSRARGYGSSDDDDDDDDDDSENNEEYEDRFGQSGGRMTTQKKNRKVGQAGQEGDATKKTDEDIVRTHLNVDEASKLFQNATGVDSRGVDFSTSIQRRRKKQEYYPRTAATFETTTYSLGTGTGYRTADDDAEGRVENDSWRQMENESRVDRFRRLRFEMEELQKELDSQSTEEVQVDSERVDGPPSNDLLQQLHALREQLTKLDEQGTMETLVQKKDVARWQAEARRLVQDLDTQSKAKTSVKDDAAETHTQQSELVRFGDLDRRLAGLEKLVGVQEALQDESNALPRPLLPALARIEQLLTFLTQPRHLDGISRRIKVLVSELERVHEARRKLIIPSSTTDGEGSKRDAVDGNGAISEQTLKRLDGVLPLMSKVEPLLPVVPTLLARLRSLSSLHASSASLAHDVEALEGVLRSSQSQNGELKHMLQSLEVSFAENEQRTKNNLGLVEERLEAIVKRMDTLARS